MNGFDYAALIRALPCDMSAVNSKEATAFWKPLYDQFNNIRKDPNSSDEDVIAAEEELSRSLNRTIVYVEPCQGIVDRIRYILCLSEVSNSDRKALLGIGRKIAEKESVSSEGAVKKGAYVNLSDGDLQKIWGLFKKYSSVVLDESLGLQNVYLDTETTGLKATSEVLEIAIIDDDSTILLNTLLKPTKEKAWPGAMAIHNITPEDVKDSPTLSSIKEKIEEIISGKNLVIYNSSYDAPFLERAGVNLFFAANISCAMNSYQNFSGQDKWAKLSDAMDEIGGTWKGTSHRALSDANAAMQVWKHIKSAGSREVL